MHLESGHEEFVDNLEEGLIIQVNATKELKLINKAARLMLHLSEDDNKIEETADAKAYKSIGMLKQIKLKPVRLTSS